MLKKNIFHKSLQKSVISITKRIESFFNFFKENFFNKKKKNLSNIDNKIILTVALIFISISSYFLLPSFYDQNKIKTQIESQILEKYNLEVKLEESLNYGIFPKPHFYSENVKIHYKSNEIANSKNIRVSIITKNLFSINNVTIKDLVFKETDFKLNFSNINLFIDLMNNIENTKKIDFLKSKLFYLDQNEDIIFLSELKNLSYLTDDNSIKKLSSKLEVFNIPIDLDVEHNIFKKKFFTKIKSFPLRLNIQSNSNYDDKKLIGDLDLKMINKNININYEFKDKFLKFNSKNKDITGNINIKPFFLSLDLDLFNLNLKKIFEDNSILINILKSETLNNKNLNGIIDINLNNLKSINFLDEIEYNIILEEGEIFIQDLFTTFKDGVIINLNDTNLIVDDGKLKFAGFLNLDFIDVKRIFEHFQINIKDRKYIKKINLEFLFHFDEEYVEIYNLKVDGRSDKKLEKFLQNFNTKKDNLFNKIVVRNSVKDFFRIISLD